MGWGGAFEAPPPPPPPRTPKKPRPNRVKPNIVKPGFCLIHFTITFAGETNVHRYDGNIVKPKIVKPRFHCILCTRYSSVCPVSQTAFRKTSYPRAWRPQRKYHWTCLHPPGDVTWFTDQTNIVCGGNDRLLWTPVQVQYTNLGSVRITVFWLQTAHRFTFSVQQYVFVPCAGDSQKFLAAQLPRWSLL